MSEAQINELCQAALERIQKYINRMAAQQVRRMREEWSKRA